MNGIAEHSEGRKSGTIARPRTAPSKAKTKKVAHLGLELELGRPSTAPGRTETQKVAARTERQDREGGSRWRQSPAASGIVQAAADGTVYLTKQQRRLLPKVTDSDLASVQQHLEGCV